MTRKTPANVAASVRARLLKVSKERREDFTLTLMNYAGERFLNRLSQSKYRDQFVLKGALLFAIRVGEQYRPTRDLDLLGLGEASEAAVATAIRDIVATKVDDDGLVFDVDGLEVHPIREENVYGGIRAIMQARLVKRERLRDFESLSQVVEELRVFLSRPFEHVKTKQPFDARWAPGGPWT